MFIAVLITVFIIMTFLGHVFHWAFHQPWTGRFYKSHLNHHTIQYPPEDYLSDAYREAGKDNSAYIFAIAFSPILIGILLLGLFKVIPLLLSIVIILEMILVGLANDYIHEHLHIKNSIFNRFKFFQKLRELHYLHHVDMSKNFGIFTFIWDKVFNTYINQ